MRRRELSGPRPRRRATAVLLLPMALLAGCATDAVDAGTPPAVSQAGASARSPAAVDPSAVPSDATAVIDGERSGTVGETYRLASFLHPVELTLPDASELGGPWHLASYDTHAAATLDFAEEAGYPGVSFLAPAEVFAPGSRWQDRVFDAAPTSVDGWLDWLAGHPELEVSAPEPVTVGGREGQQVTVTAAAATQRCAGTARCVPIMAFSEAVGTPLPLGLFATDQSQLVLLPFDDGVVLVSFSGAAARWDEVTPLLDALRTSLRWS